MVRCAARQAETVMRGAGIARRLAGRWVILAQQAIREGFRLPAPPRALRRERLGNDIPRCDGGTVSA
jgi:hypothetical protein